MRIVVLGTRGFPKIQGGVEAHCENLYPLLAKRGCEVIVLGRKAYTGETPYVYLGVRIIPLACIQNKHLEALFHTFLGIFAARKLKPDILHIHSIGPGFFVPLARLLGLRVVLTTHGENYRHLKWGVLARIFLRGSEFLAVTFANRVIAISSLIAQGVRTRFGKEAVVIPNGVRSTEPVSTDDILRKCRLIRGQYFLAVGRFVPEKGLHDLVEAYALLKKPAWKLVIVGASDHEDDYSRNLKERAASIPDVVLTGFLTGTPLKEIFSHAGIFILPSYYEGLPIALLEAMSYGLSCLVSNIPANREVGIDEERCFPVGDLNTLAAKMDGFSKATFSSDERKRQIDRVLEEYDWEKIAAKTYNVYQELLR